MKLLKKAKLLVIISLISSFICINANASPGDIIHPIYSTDILTYMDGIPIQGYNINGRTLICLEDLSNYGFSVYYNDDIRTLFVNKIGTAPDDYNPNITKDVVGRVVGYTYETDIKAILNGEEIPAESIGGRLAVCVEHLDDLHDSFLSGSFNVKNFPKYFMMQSYNDTSRILNIYSNLHISEMYEDNIRKFKTDIEEKNVATEIVNTYTNDEYTQYIYRGAARNYYANDDSLNVVRFYKSGRIVDYKNILHKYFFIGNYNAGTSLNDYELSPYFSEDGRVLFFKAKRAYPTVSLMGTTNVFETGKYALDLNTCELEKLDLCD